MNRDLLGNALRKGSRSLSICMLDEGDAVIKVKG